MSSYDTVGSIPFVVIGRAVLPRRRDGQSGDLQGLNAADVQGQINNQSGAAWNAISPTAYLLEAFLVKTDGGQPASVANSPSVAALLAQIH